jgi:preprotein translocase subunit SecY
VLSVAKLFAVDGSGDSDAALVSAVLRYFAVLFVAAVAVPYAVRTRAQSAAAAASVFAFLPTLLFSIINVGFATLFLHDPHAMLSSVLILLATIGATAGGAVLGTWRPGRS